MTRDDVGARAAVLRLSPVPTAARRAAAEWQIGDPGDAVLSRQRVGHPDRRDGRTRRRPQKTLGDRFFDNGYDEVPDGSVFALSGGDRRIEVHFDEGLSPRRRYSRPATTTWSCFEPMAAPTDSLRRGGYRAVNPGESAVAQFRIKVVGCPNARRRIDNATAI